MNCLHVISGDLWAGAEAATFHLVRELDRQGLELSVLLFNDGELAARLRAAGIGVTILDERRYSFPQLARQMVAHARRRRPDVIHSHRCKEHLLSSIASVASGALHVRTAHGVAGPDDEAVPWRSRLAGGVDAIVSRALRERWIAVAEALVPLLPAPRTRIRVIANGLPEQAPAPRRRDLLEAFDAAEAGGTAGEPWVIGYVGRLEVEKRPDRFVRVIAKLPDRIAGRTVRAVLAGDGARATEAQREARALCIEPRVRFLGHRPDGDALLAGLDVLVIPSDREGHPMVMLEAMRAGVPIVASAVGGIKASLGNEPFLVPRDDEDGFASAITHLLEDDAARAAWASRLRAHFDRSYAIPSTATAVIGLYREALPAASSALREAR